MSNFRLHRREAVGFTLVEVLVVATIIIIFATMVVLRTKSIIDKSKVSSTKETLAKLAEAAKQIKNDTSYYVLPFDWDNDLKDLDYVPYVDCKFVERGAISDRWSGPYVGYNETNSVEFPGNEVAGVPGGYAQGTERWPVDSWGTAILFVCPGDDYFTDQKGYEDSYGYFISFGIDRKPGDGVTTAGWNEIGGTNGVFDPWRGEKPKRPADHSDPDSDDIIYRF